MNIQSIVGLKIEGASSSLNKFAMRLSDGRGLVLEANDKDEEFIIETTLVEEKELPKLAEAVCTVDWTWIEKSEVVKVNSLGDSVSFSLSPAGLLVIGLGAWEGKPFLSFRPFKPAK